MLCNSQITLTMNLSHIIHSQFHYMFFMKKRYIGNLDVTWTKRMLCFFVVHKVCCILIGLVWLKVCKSYKGVSVASIPRATLSFEPKYGDRS